jgi:glycosyltransferase involved in cell wall biosynthesis
MNFLIISLMSGSPWGGSEELWRLIAEYSIERGDELTISLKKWPINSPKVEHLFKQGSKLLEWREKRKSLFSRLVYRLVKYESKQNQWNFIKENKYDHVLVSFGGAYDILNHKELMRLLSANGIKFSVIQQYNEENIFLSNEDRSEVRSFFKGASNVFFVSNRNKITSERNLVCALKNAKIVSNPALKIEELVKNKDFPTSQKLKIACVARFDVGLKNQDLLIQSFASESWKDRDFELSLYGKGPGEEYLSDLISFYGLNSKVKIMGHVDEISQVWKNNQCMILASSSEGSPLSIIEAMYCSRAVIATNVGGNQELIDDTCGFIIPGVNIISISETLENVWQKRSELEKMGQKSFERISMIHNPVAYKKIYEYCHNNN